MRYTDLSGGTTLQEDFRKLNTGAFAGKITKKSDSGFFSRLFKKIGAATVLGTLGAFAGPAGALVAASTGFLLFGKSKQKIKYYSKEYDKLMKSGLEDKIEQFHNNFQQGIDKIKSNKQMVDDFLYAFTKGQDDQIGIIFGNWIADRDEAIERAARNNSSTVEIKKFLDRAGQQIENIAKETGIRPVDVANIYGEKYKTKEGNTGPLNSFFMQIAGSQRWFND